MLEIVPGSPGSGWALTWHRLLRMEVVTTLPTFPGRPLGSADRAAGTASQTAVAHMPPFSLLLLCLQTIISYEQLR